MTRNYLTGVFCLGTWLLMFFTSNLAAEPAGTIGYAQERYKLAPIYEGPVRTGEQVYDYACKTCHDRTTQGASLPDDEIE